VEDLAKYDLSSGRPIELRWKDEYLEKPVLRNVTAEGPQDVPLHKERFCEILRGIATTAGYSKAVTVHKIQKYLGSVIEGEIIQHSRPARENILINSTGKHGSAPVSQIYGHKDARTYPKNYLLHCSSIDTVSAVLGEEEQSNHIEYFQVLRDSTNMDFQVNCRQKSRRISCRSQKYSTSEVGSSSWNPRMPTRNP
jgi:hypothetical protein